MRKEGARGRGRKRRKEGILKTGVTVTIPFLREYWMSSAEPSLKR